MWTQSCFKSGFWMCFEMRKNGVLDRDLPTKPDSRTCECKALSERDLCVCILKMHTKAMHLAHGSISARRLRSRGKILLRSAEILIMIGKAFVIHVNAHSSNPNPIHVLDYDSKCLSECDSSPCDSPPPPPPRWAPFSGLVQCSARHFAITPPPPPPSKYPGAAPV